MLQTRNGKRTAAAALKIACDLVDEGMISREEAVMRVEPKQLDSLLHPQFDAAALKAVEDEAIVDLVHKQQKAGYHAITDGEFRRATWHLDFMWGFNGVGHAPTQTGLPFHGEAAMIDDIDDTYLTGKVSLDTHSRLKNWIDG